MLKNRFRKMSNEKAICTTLVERFEKLVSENRRLSSRIRVLEQDLLLSEQSLKREVSIRRKLEEMLKEVQELQEIIENFKND